MLTLLRACAHAYQKTWAWLFTSVRTCTNIRYAPFPTVRVRGRVTADDVCANLKTAVITIIYGRRKPQADESGPTRPRSILITLESDWDKRLLLSKCRNLKEFPTHKKLFLRADLPPDHPQRGNRLSSEASHPDSHPSSQPRAQGASVPLNSASSPCNAKSPGSASGPSAAHHDQ